MYEQRMECEEEMPNAHIILNVKGTDLPSDTKLMWDNRDVKCLWLSKPHKVLEASSGKP